MIADNDLDSRMIRYDGPNHLEVSDAPFKQPFGFDLSGRKGRSYDRQHFIEMLAWEGQTSDA